MRSARAGWARWCYGGASISEAWPLSQFAHPWGYDDFADYAKRCTAPDTHPGFSAYLSATERVIVAKQSRLIRGVDALGRGHDRLDDQFGDSEIVMLQEAALTPRDIAAL